MCHQKAETCPKQKSNGVVFVDMIQESLIKCNTNNSWMQDSKCSVLKVSIGVFQKLALEWTKCWKGVLKRSTSLSRWIAKAFSKLCNFFSKMKFNSNVGYNGYSSWRSAREQKVPQDCLVKDLTFWQVILECFSLFFICCYMVLAFQNAS
jgi:hypothetical protein